jgi:hypothetical protein
MAAPINHLRPRTATLVLVATLGIFGCGGASRADYSCAELKAEPKRYRAMAREIFRAVVPAAEREDPGDCDRACARKFTDSLERQLKAACRRGDNDLRPRDPLEEEYKEFD